MALRPKPQNHHWSKGRLAVRGTSANLYWTPDPEHSPVLRQLRGECDITFVPEIKFEHWIIVRVEHQLGWVSWRDVEIIEIEPPPPPPVPTKPAIDPRQFLDDDDTLHTRPAVPPVSVNANRQETAHIPAQKRRTPPPKKAEQAVSSGDIRRLIGGIRRALSGAFGRDD